MPMPRASDDNRPAFRATTDAAPRAPDMMQVRGSRTCLRLVEQGPGPSVREAGLLARKTDRSLRDRWADRPLHRDLLPALAGRFQ